MQSGDKWAEYKVRPLSLSALSYDADADGVAQAYLARTSILIPFPPSLYRLLPSIVKKTLFLDLPMFGFDENVDGPIAVADERKSNE